LLTDYEFPRYLLNLTSQLSDGFSALPSTWLSSSPPDVDPPPFTGVPPLTSTIARQVENEEIKVTLSLSRSRQTYSNPATSAITSTPRFPWSRLSSLRPTTSAPDHTSRPGETPTSLDRVNSFRPTPSGRLGASQALARNDAPSHRPHICYRNGRKKQNSTRSEITLSICVARGLKRHGELLFRYGEPLNTLVSSAIAHDKSEVLGLQVVGRSNDWTRLGIFTGAQVSENARNVVPSCESPGVSPRVPQPQPHPHDHLFRTRHQLLASPTQRHLAPQL
jgi:hypothetical protein